MKEAFYFPHFIGARNDRKIKRVRRDLGVEGYALYFMTLEVLREEKELAYPMEDIDILADDFGTSEAKLKAIVINYDLFTVRETTDGHMFFSPKQIQYLEPYFNRRELSRLNGIKSGIARRKKAEQLVLELSDKDSTKQVFNNSSAPVELRKNERKKEKKETKETISLKEKREGFEKFRNEFKKMHTTEEFCVNGFGFDNIPLILNLDGLIMNAQNFQFLPRKTAFEIWDYLYRNKDISLAS